tara:strand:+ start:27878 stop:29032 length:1155 start_codon:yes stop_codon:yes gene_type:complete
MNPQSLIDILSENGIEFYAGVPDSLLASFSNGIGRNPDLCKHVSAANEGSAVALAAGHYLATGKMPCIYMQNSGLGNALNPLVSLMDREIYGIPALLVIGWRAEQSDGVQLKDEPQHRKQGRITPQLLDTLAIPYEILGPQGLEGDSYADVTSLIKEAQRAEQPAALLVRKAAFLSEASEASVLPDEECMSREDAIAEVVRVLAPQTCIVGTTGKISRELYEIRQRGSEGGELDFLTVGSMGHASQIAVGMAMADAARPVVCLDGDGACFMHMGGLATAAKVKNFRHLVLNNGVHDSVGGQETCAPDLSLVEIAKACGYAFVDKTDNIGDLHQKVQKVMSASGSAFLEITVRPGARPDLGRPSRSPKEAKVKFMRMVSSVLPPD